MRNISKIIYVLMAMLCCTACVKYSDELLESSKNQITHEFYGNITYPANLVVILSPVDATYIQKGVKQPILLHKLIENRLRNLHFIRHDDNSYIKYALTVKKQGLESSNDALSAGYTDALENMGISEAPYIIEIYLDEIETSPAGDEIFGKRLAMFTTLMQRNEEDIANDIVNIIMDEIR